MPPSQASSNGRPGSPTFDDARLLPGVNPGKAPQARRMTADSS